MKIDLHGKTHPEGLELIEEYMLLNSVKGSVSLHVITGNSPVMQKKIIDPIQITPEETRNFFKKIPESERPMIGTELEIAQIVITPKVSQAAKQVVID